MAATEDAGGPLVVERVEVGTGDTRLELDLLCRSATEWMQLCKEENSAVADSTGQRIYAGGRVLAECLCARPDIVRGKRVLELGCGLGLAGFVGAQLGAAEVLLTDGNDETLAMARRNAARLGLEARTRVLPLLWGSPSPEPPFDVVLGGDLFYYRVPLPELLDSALALRAPDGVVLLAHVLRVPEHHHTLVARATEAGLAVQRLPIAQIVPAELLAADPQLHNVTTLVVGRLPLPEALAALAQPFDPEAGDEAESGSESDGEAGGDPELLAAILSRLGQDSL